ncbi:SURF1 family protein [Propionibacteriaceae bacterium G57]|uniref:SURF1 family protein n=1 Tax=Aestuariimicrobium sp. G57 TaxID=3418485 RepID=UPI003DA6DC4B
MSAVRVKQAAVMLLGLVVAGLMVFLGLWQASTFRTQGQEATQERAKIAAVALPAGAGDQIGALYGRQVTVTGEYLPEYQYYIGEKPPLRVVTAFRTTTGQVVPVVRGEVAEGETATPVPSGVQTQTGLLMPSEKDLTSTPTVGLPTPVMVQVKLESLAQQWPTPLLNGFVTLNEADARDQQLTPATVVLPDGSGSQRNAGYALQWWIFAAFALVMCAVRARQFGKNAAKEAARKARGLE